jgi:hypothetical protein
MKHRKIIVFISVVIILILASGFYMVNRTKTQISDLFRLNKELQEEGYYMAEFEFKMLGIAYYLDKGHYYTAFARINQLHNQLKTKEGLIEMPEFQNKAEELEFYLNLQNPNTGAFMDESYPYCTYTGPTGNVLLHLASLAAEIGQPLKLKYPLKYLDEINTPEKLNAYLDDVSTVGWIAAKFPQTTFHNARDVLSLFHEDNTVEKYNLYNVSPEIKQALLQWFYNNQDPETGLWGPKSKSGKLMKKDVMNTVSIVKVFVDEEGKNIYESFPLRYKDELSKSILEELSEPIPEDDELDEWHEWNLKTYKSIKALTDYLWNDISKSNKEKAKDFIEYYIRIKFEKFYIPEEGSFSYYPHGEHATIDGTGEFFIFKKIGALSGERQEQLWGTPKENIINLGTHKISDFTKSDFDLIANSKSVNSLRLYKTTPDYKDLISGISAVIYPKKIPVLDIVDLTPRIKHWLNTTNQTMGNWSSKENIIRELENIKIEEVPAYENDIPIESAQEILQNNGKLVVIGFDILQVPRYEIVYELDRR